MLIVTGEMRIDPKDMPAMREAALPLMAETEKERGCRIYRFYEDIGRPGQVRVYEEWESEADLQVHLKAPHVQSWREAMEAVKVLDRKVVVLRGAEISDL